MINLFEEAVQTTDLVGIAGIFTPVIVLSIILLLIARFRGFWSSLFFIPAMCAILSFAITMDAVNDLVTGFGPYGEGLLKGISIFVSPFVYFHLILVELVSALVNVEMVTNIISADWFVLVPYLLLFLIFFSTCKIKRKRKADNNL